MTGINKSIDVEKVLETLHTEEDNCKLEVIRYTPYTGANPKYAFRATVLNPKAEKILESEKEAREWLSKQIKAVKNAKRIKRKVSCTVRIDDRYVPGHVTGINANTGKWKIMVGDESHQVDGEYISKPMPESSANRLTEILGSIDALQKEFRNLRFKYSVLLPRSYGRITEITRRVQMDEEMEKKLTS